jgi:hypothetical protein
MPSGLAALKSRSIGEQKQRATGILGIVTSPHEPPESEYAQPIVPQPIAKNCYYWPLHHQVQGFNARKPIWGDSLSEAPASAMQGLDTVPDIVGERRVVGWRRGCTEEVGSALS